MINILSDFSQYNSNSRDSISWIDLDLNSSFSSEELKDSLQIPDGAFSALVAEDTRPRFNQYNEGSLVILRGVNYNPDRDPEDMVSLRIWFTDNLIVSFRKQSLRSISEITKLINNGEGPIGVSDFLESLLRGLIQRISDVVSSTVDGIDELDESMTLGDSGDIRVKVSEYRVDIISLKRHLSPLRETLNRLHSLTPDIFMDIKHLFLEHTETLIRCLEDLDSSRERCTVIQEEFNTRINEKMNRTIYQMSIVATIFLPLSLLTGILGINVGGIPGVNSSLAFPIVCGILVIIAIVEYIIFKKRNDL